jgi:hypothetical protein
MHLAYKLCVGLVGQASNQSVLVHRCWCRIQCYKVFVRDRLMLYIVSNDSRPQGSEDVYVVAL